MTAQHTRKAIPVGRLSGDLKSIAAICRQRMRSRGSNVQEWLMWADDKGHIYFSDSIGTHASKVIMERPDMKICAYKGAAVKAEWIYEDLYDRARRAGLTLAQVAASYMATA